MKAISMSSVWFRARCSAVNLIENCRGNSATEFALIVPLMLVMFFGTVELSSGVAVDRKMSLIARTLSDLTSQSGSTSQAGSQQLTDAYLQNVFTAAISIAYPYDPTPTKATISQIYVDSTGKATIQWSAAAIIASSTATQATLTASSHSYGDIVTPLVPPQLLIKKTYMLLAEANYLYTPAVGYVMKTAITLQDTAFSRPRQFVCLFYQTFTPPYIAPFNTPVVTPPNCPTP